MNKKPRFESSASSRLEKGQGLVEYAMILVLVAIVVVAALALLGPKVGQIYNQVVLAIQYPDLGFSATTTRSADDVNVRITSNYEISLDLRNPANSFSISDSCEGTCNYQLPAPSASPGTIEISSHGATIAIAYPGR